MPAVSNEIIRESSKSPQNLAQPEEEKYYVVIDRQTQCTCTATIIIVNTKSLPQTPAYKIVSMTEVNGRSTFGSPCQHCFIISAKWGSQVSGIGGRYIIDNKEKLLVLLCTKKQPTSQYWGYSSHCVQNKRRQEREYTAKHCNYYIVSIVILVTVKLQPNVTHHAIQDFLKQCKLNNIRKWFFPCQNLPKEYSKRVHVTCF